MSKPAAPVPAHPAHLGDAINTATRSIHAKLNKLILTRLPLALPPLGNTPAVYVSGLLHFAPVYIAFESLWQDILQPHRTRAQDLDNPACGPDGYEPGNPLLDSQSVLLFPLSNNSGGTAQGPSTPSTDTLSHKPQVCDRIHSLLEHMFFPGLQRSSSLRSDIRAATGWSEQVVEEQLRGAQTDGSALRDFVEHIHAKVPAEPHILLAYAWVLYMALFSGGRFIRGALEGAGQGFWGANVDEVRTGKGVVACEVAPGEGRGARGCVAADGGQQQAEPETLGEARPCSEDSTAVTGFPLAFFRFDTPHDGEDIKVEFKKRLVESEALLTSGERAQVVAEAETIFKFMIGVVEQLDAVFSSGHGSTFVPVKEHAALAAAHASSPAVQLPSSSSSDPSATSPQKFLTSPLSAPSETWSNLRTPRGGSRLRDSVAVAKDRAQARKLGPGHRQQGIHTYEEDVGEHSNNSSNARSGSLPHEADLARSRSSTTTSESSVYVRSMVTPAAELADLMTHPAAAKTVHFEKTLKRVPHGKGPTDESGRKGRIGSMDGSAEEWERRVEEAWTWAGRRILWQNVAGGVVLALGLAYLYVRHW